MRANLSGRNVPNRIVLFPELCQHIASTARVLRQPAGHMLMIGIGGTGKKAVVQLASYMQFCEFFHPTVSKHYNIHDFKEDIRKAMLRSGIQGMKVVLFINDRNIVQVRFSKFVSYFFFFFLQKVIANERTYGINFLNLLTIGVLPRADLQRHQWI